MLTTGDSILTDLQPPMKWDEWVDDISKVIEDSNYHLDEVSESDEEKAKSEKDDMIRTARKEDSNHVLHVYDKSWRSRKVCINVYNIINTFIGYLIFKFQL
jgi:hypothetical protein